ncbi:unnamed protein product [Ambrosiozyma monospora]|uniref:Unnamed protein product n=1 Tax=Ambrosiozyma monospora TaxID=43982 RepID=A0ACB5TVD3_AMBMO|nr:unnamed protein product [Ambrosiozyma monospora]
MLTPSNLTLKEQQRVDTIFIHRLDDYAPSQLKIADSPDGQQIDVGIMFDADLQLDTEEMTRFFEQELMMVLNDSSDYAYLPTYIQLIFQASSNESQKLESS